MRVPLVLLPLLLVVFPAFAQEDALTPVQVQEETHRIASSDNPDATEAKTLEVPLDEIRRFVSVFNAVKQAYVEPVNDEVLMHSAVRGLLLELDPHSAYLDKEDAQDFDEQAKGSYEGIGVELLTQPDGALKVLTTMEGAPAARAGIKPDDIIIEVDGKALAQEKNGMKKISGAAGTKVKLTIKREKVAKPFDRTLQREVIHVVSVNSRLLEPGYGYIRISAFQADTGVDFRKAVNALKAKGKLKGVVLDLRSNPGGLLASAIQVADDLLEQGMIVSTKGRMSASDAEFFAAPGDRLKGVPIVVLVDAGSASAAEVLAGALRENNRVRVVGSRTFGKGSVQTILPLDNGDSVKLTTARYYTPSGKSIQASGIVPDVVLMSEDAVNQEVATPSRYSEAALPGHLPGDQEGAEGYTIGVMLSGDAPITQALAELKHLGSIEAAQRAMQQAASTKDGKNKK